jgi:hypothetical protein
VDGELDFLARINNRKECRYQQQKPLIIGVVFLTASSMRHVCATGAEGVAVED